MKLKKILALVLALALVCCTFAGCSGSGSENVMIVNAGMEPTGLNTLTSTYSIEFSMFRHLYENLYMLDENDVPQPAAAESVDVSEDSMKYTFHLREDGVWTNGDPVTANDFAFAWQQVLNPEVAADYNYFLFFIENAEAYYNGEVSWEEVGVKVIDDYTLEVTLGTPTPYAPFMFSFGTMCPVNQKFYEEVGADNYSTEAEYFCTNGPFMLTEWSHDSVMVTEKFEDFHGADEIGLDRIEWVIITDAQAALTSYLAGDVDMVGLTTGELIQQAEAEGNTVTDYADGSAFYIYMNHNNEYLSNVNLRQALALGFDKQGMIDTVQKNNNLAMTSFTSPSVNGFDGTSFAEALNAQKGDLHPVNGDVAKAQEYLAVALEELGCTVDDLSANLSVDCGDDATSQAMAAYYQNQWLENLGIDVTINPMITKQGSENRSTGNYVMSLTGWGPDYNDPMTFLDLWVTGGGNNQTGFSNAEYDECINNALVETDLAKRQDYFYRCEEIIAEQLPIAPVYWRVASYTYNPKFQGIIRSTFQDICLTHVTVVEE